MKERRDVIILTKRHTLIEGWVEKKDETTLCVKIDKNTYPHLKGFDASEVIDVSIEHNFGDRYSCETPFNLVPIEN